MKLKGWVEYAEYLDILAANDVFIHASLHEPFGIPPMDAMRYGKLVIARNNDTALIFKPKK